MKKIALSATILLFGLLNAHGQYMSFFGDSTWKYQYTLISRPPQDYLDYPPETPNSLGVYCITMSSCFSKDKIINHHLLPYSPINCDQYLCDLFSQCHDHDGEAHPEVWQNEGQQLYEDTVYGRLFDNGYLICDMSLSEGDTFVYKGLCGVWYSNPPDTPIAPNQPDDTIRFSMIVDSVRYCEGRKNVFLSLLNHQDDYFFGSGNQGLLNDYNLSIRFIEGIGPTYGLLDTWCVFRNLYNMNHGFPNVYYHYFGPQLGLLQCMYKDDSLVYMVNENLGCDQSCFGLGLQQYSLSYLNLYPNPATEYVVLDLSTGEEMDGSVMITDMLGRRCLQQKAEGTKCQISVSDLPVGMYFLTYTDGERKVTKKFLKK